jgi:hypothetical protein
VPSIGRHRTVDDKFVPTIKNNASPTRANGQAATTTHSTTALRLLPPEPAEVGIAHVQTRVPSAAKMRKENRRSKSMRGRPRAPASRQMAKEPSRHAEDVARPRHQLICRRALV